MTTVQTLHYRDTETGEQQTVRRVTVTDAAGREFDHDFWPTEDGGHVYDGEGTPPESAVEAIEEWEETHDDA